jgi:hypothetical protein
MPFGNGDGATLLELLDDRARLEAEAGALKGRLTQLNQRITDLVKPQMDAAYAREGQPSGTVKFAVGNQMFKAVVDKRVEWDSDALKDIASKISPVTAAVLFKISYSMSEAIFKDIDVPELRAKLTIARTVKYGAPKITSAEKAEV